MKPNFEEIWLLISWRLSHFATWTWFCTKFRSATEITSGNLLGREIKPVVELSKFAAQLFPTNYSRVSLVSYWRAYEYIVLSASFKVLRGMKTYFHRWRKCERLTSNNRDWATWCSSEWFVFTFSWYFYLSKFASICIQI